MQIYQYAIIFAAVVVIVLVIGMFRNRIEWILNFILRGITGFVAIYFINMFLEKQQICEGIGINAVNILTSAILGFPGLVLVYGINFYKFL